MTTLSYLPHQIDADWTSDPFGVHVGGDDALATMDDAASYVQVTAASRTAHSFRIYPTGGAVDTSGPPPDVTQVVVRYDTSGTNSSHAVGLGCYLPSVGGLTATNISRLASSSGFATETYTINPSWVASWWPEQFDPGAFWSLNPLNPAFGFTMVMRFTYLRIDFTWLSVEPKPLRQKQRDDGLGRSVVRARSTHSVQRSTRQRGYR